MRDIGFAIVRGFIGESRRKRDGGESGKGHRPMPLEWESAIREDCRAFGIPYFFKQLAGKQPIPADFPLVRQFPEVSHV